MLAGKVSIITGAAQGIGREIALLLAANGSKVVIADINYTGAKETAREVEKLGGEAYPMDIDMGESAMIENMIKRTINKFGRLDIAVNNAAYVKKTGFLDYSIEEWKRVVDISLNGYFYCTQLSAKEMQKSGGGKIINIASMVGFIPHGGLTAYSAAKAAVIAMTKLASNELKKHNICVNAIAPGPTDTPLMKNVLSRGETEEKNIPAAIVESAGTVAKMVLLLASEKDNLISGNVINVGGGVLG